MRLHRIHVKTLFPTLIQASKFQGRSCLGFIELHPLIMLSSIARIFTGVVDVDRAFRSSHNPARQLNPTKSMPSSPVRAAAMGDAAGFRRAQWRLSTLTRSISDVSSPGPRSCIQCTATSATNSTLVPSKDAKGLADFINQGPLMPCINISKEEVEAAIHQWQVLGSRLATQLKFNEDNLSPAELSRIYHYYLPAFMWVTGQLERHRAAHGTLDKPPRALVVGITAPQGCGKTTLVEQLVELLCHTGRKAVAVSIDDFYLTYEKQQELAKQHPGNNLLQLRGNAGSHDMALGARTISALAELKENEKMGVPRYNKSAYGGRGDRYPESEWEKAEGPLQVVLVEGWMLGFQPQSPEEISKVDPMVGRTLPRDASSIPFSIAMDGWAWQLM
eukprot:jgi/Mesvir1/14234/Mv25053-RA.2